MAFTIARGSSPDSCGAGCNQWIVADGFFDKDVDKRFRKFLDGLHGRKRQAGGWAPGFCSGLAGWSEPHERVTVLLGCGDVADDTPVRQTL